jgi:putative ABC transport system permease protein
MIRNYFIIAWRNMIRNKVNTLINVTGLAIGIASVILILFYVQDELKFDHFFKKADHIFRVNFNGTENGVDFLTSNTPPLIGPSLTDEFPEIETYVRMYRPSGDMMVQYQQGNKIQSSFTERSLYAVDSNFLEVFSYKMKEGDPATCLQKLNSLVITERIAKKYFGNDNAMGKILLFNTEKVPFVVTGVLQDIPPQASIQFEMLAPISTYPVVKFRSWNWFWLQVDTYVKLKDQVPVDQESIRRLEAKFPEMTKRKAAPVFEKYYGTSFDEFIRKGNKLNYQLQPLTSVHLYSTGIGSRLTTIGSIKYVYIFSVIALFIIILACVNFMNLSIAQAARRGKEVGIRKVLGSLKKQLIKQFLSEALLFSLIATFVALIIVILLLKPFNEIAGKSLDIGLLFSGYTWAYVLCLCLLTGILAGSYPAFYLTSFRPVFVLKGMNIFKSGLGNLLIRNGLVIFQFTVSTALIICTVVVYKQLQFTQETNLGLNKENVVIIANSNRLQNREESFRQELTQLPEIIDASISSSVPARGSFGDSYVPEQTGINESIIKEIALSSFQVDNNFVPTFQIKIIQGRNFSKDFFDSASVILNETAVKQIGWKNPVGKYLDYPGNDQRFKVIGVARDFNIESLHTPITPFALFHVSSKTYSVGNSNLSARIKPGNIIGQINKIEKKWKGFAPNAPFDFSFMDSEFEKLYRSEKRMGTVFGIFTFLSIFVACLGLFGLAAYTAEKRQKEIGIRKVLGASVAGITRLLSKDFLNLVVVAIIIASPLAWFFMHKWLQDFAYRINIGWWIFVLAGVAALMIALITVSYQAIKAAIANPVKSLRTE